jgi:glutamate/tyrosine decarboxylase-like PLP-dependent enzyme
VTVANVALFVAAPVAEPEADVMVAVARSALLDAEPVPAALGAETVTVAKLADTATLTEPASASGAAANGKAPSISYLTGCRFSCRRWRG